MHQLGAVAVRTLQAATATAAALAGGPAVPPLPLATTPPSRRELGALAVEAARGMSYSLQALQLVYGSCSTEVLYELELLAQLLDAVPQPAPPPPPPAAAAVTPAAPHRLTVQLELQQAEQAERCTCCLQAGGSAHMAVVHTRLSYLLVEVLLPWCSSAAAAGSSGGGKGAGGPYLELPGPEGLKALRDEARALYGCVGWHVWGRVPQHV
jgi:hypothetical protein